MATQDDGSRTGNPRAMRPGVPGIKSAVARRVRYPKPRRFFTAGREHAEADVLEVDVETDADFPIAGTGPALFVGDVVLIDSERICERRYRFFAPASTPVAKDASVALGRAGTGIPRPETPQGPLRLEWSADASD